MSTSSETSASWWVGLSSDEFYRGVRQHNPRMHQQSTVVDAEYGAESGYRWPRRWRVAGSTITVTEAECDDS